MEKADAEEMLRSGTKEAEVLKGLGMLGKGGDTPQENAGYFTSDKIAENSKKNIWVTEFFLEKLAKNGYIDKGSNDKSVVYKISAKGIEESIAIDLLD